MSGPFREAGESPLVKRAVAALKQAQVLLDSFEEQLRDKTIDQGVDLVARLGGVHRVVGEDDHDTVDHLRRAVWSNINEARKLLGEAGFDVGATVGDEEELWSEESAVLAPGRWGRTHHAATKASSAEAYEPTKGGRNALQTASNGPRSDVPAMAPKVVHVITLPMARAWCSGTEPGAQ